MTQTDNQIDEILKKDNKQAEEKYKQTLLDNSICRSLGNMALSRFFRLLGMERETASDFLKCEIEGIRWHADEDFPTIAMCYWVVTDKGMLKITLKGIGDKKIPNDEMVSAIPPESLVPPKVLSVFDYSTLIKMFYAINGYDSVDIAVGENKITFIYHEYGFTHACIEII